IQVRDAFGNVALVGKHRARHQGKCEPHGCGFLKHRSHLSLSGSWIAATRRTESAGATGDTLEPGDCCRVTEMRNFSERGRVHGNEAIELRWPASGLEPCNAKAPFGIPFSFLARCFP